VTNEELIKLIVMIKGTDDVKELKDGLDKLESALKRTGEAADATGDETKEALGKAASAGKDLGAAAAKAIGGDASAAFERLTDAASGVAVALGAGVGVLAAFKALEIAAPVLGEALQRAFKPEEPKAYADSVKGIQDRIKELEEKPLRLRTDFAELNLLKKKLESLQDDAKKLNALLGKQSEAEKQSGEQVSEILGDVNARPAVEKFRRDFVTSRAQTQVALATDDKGNIIQDEIDKARQDIAVIRASGQGRLEDIQAIGKLNEKIVGLQKKLNEAAEAAVKDANTALSELLERATDGVGREQKQAQEQIAAGLGKRGNQRMVENLQRSTPEGVEAQWMVEKDQQKGEELLKARKKRDEEAEKSVEMEKEAGKMKSEFQKEQEKQAREEERKAREEQREQEKQDRELERVQKAQEREEERKQREAERQAKELARDRPDLALGVKGMLFQGGNSDQAQNLARQGLENQGVPRATAGEMVGQQSKELADQFNTALSVTGDVNAANLSIQRELMQQNQKLLEQVLDLRRQQQELQQQMRGFNTPLQRMGS
jgi:hypothetical protein